MKKFEEPVIEVLGFSVEDVLTASSGTGTETDSVIPDGGEWN